MTWLHKYVGLPFVDGGRDMCGCDCWGLVRLIYARELSIELPSYGDTSALDLIRASRAIDSGRDSNEWIAIDRPQLREFDVVVMRYAGRKMVGHVGLALGASNVLHIELGTGAVVVPLDHWSIRERILCYRRHQNRLST